MITFPLDFIKIFLKKYNKSRIVYTYCQGCVYFLSLLLLLY